MNTTQQRIGWGLLWLSLLLALGAVGAVPALGTALRGVGPVLVGQTDAYGSGNALGTLVRVFVHFSLPYLLWQQGRNRLHQRLGY